MTTTLDRLATAAATVAREGTTTRGFFGTLSSTDTPLEVIHAWRDRMERRIATLETQVREKDATLTVLARMLRGEGGALPYTRQDALALVESALRVTEAEAREALTAELARYTADEPF